MAYPRDETEPATSGCVVLVENASTNGGITASSFLLRRSTYSNDGFINMRYVLGVGLIGLMSACSTGVQNSVEMENDLFNFTTKRNISQQVECVDNGMLPNGLKFDVAQAVDGWILTTSLHVGGLTGHIHSSKSIRHNNEITFYAEAGNFGLDLLGVQDIVYPIVKGNV